MKASTGRLLAFFFLLPAICLMTAGCGKKAGTEAQKEWYTVGVVTKSEDSEYWMSVCSGIEKAAEDYKLQVLILSPDTESNGKLQGKMIGDLIDKGVDALAISPIWSEGMDPYLERAEKNGISVVAYDTQIISEGREIPYIGIDNWKAGRELAEYLDFCLGSTGEVGIITGDLNQASHKERLEGFRSYIEEHTAIRIVFIESGYSNQQMPEKEISRLMGEHPELEGIFSTSAVTALGIADYMQRRPVKIVTVDDQQDAVKAVKNGEISALAAQPGYDIGYETIRYLVHEKEGVIKEPDRILEAKIVTGDNADDWKE